MKFPAAEPVMSSLRSTALIAVSLSLTLALEQCIPIQASTPQGYAQAPTAQAPPQPRRFCEQFGRTVRPDHTVACEDFSAVSEGTLPTGWLGGEGLGVRGRPGQGVLTPYERREIVRVVIPHWRAAGEYQFDWAMRLAIGDIGGRDVLYRVFLGSVTVTLRAGRAFPTRLSMNQSDGPELPDLTGQTVHLSLRRSGPVYQLFLNGRQAIVARYAPDELVDGVAFEVEEPHDFALFGVRLGAANAPTPPTTTPAAQGGAALPAEVRPPPLIPQMIATSHAMQCALLSDRTVRCVGEPTTSARAASSLTNITRLTGRDGTFCATNTTQMHYCWGDFGGWHGVDEPEGNQPQPLDLTAGEIIAPADGINSVGAPPLLVLGPEEVRRAAFAVSEGDRGGARVTFPGPVAQVDQSSNTICARMADQTVRCTRGDGSGVPVHDVSGAAEIGLNGWHGCAVTGSGEVRCWPICHGNESDEAPESPTCRLLSRPRGRAALRSTSVPLAAPARGLSAYDQGFCAVLSTGVVQCWQMGERQHTALRMIEGVDRVQSIASGDDQVCALQEGGVVQCWSMDNPAATRRTVGF